MAFVWRLGGSTDPGPACTLEFSGPRSANNSLTTASECCIHLAGTAQGADFPAPYGETRTFATLGSTLPIADWAAWAVVRLSGVFSLWICRLLSVSAGPLLVAEVGEAADNSQNRRITDA